MRTAPRTRRWPRAPFRAAPRSRTRVDQGAPGRRRTPVAAPVARAAEDRRRRLSGKPTSGRGGDQGKAAMTASSTVATRSASSTPGRRVLRRSRSPMAASSSRSWSRSSAWPRGGRLPRDARQGPVGAGSARRNASAAAPARPPCVPRRAPHRVRARRSRPGRTRRCGVAGPRWTPRVGRRRASERLRPHVAHPAERRTMSSSHNGSTAGTQTSIHTWAPAGDHDRPPPVDRRTTSTPGLPHPCVVDDSPVWVLPRTRVVGPGHPQRARRPGRRVLAAGGHGSEGGRPDRARSTRQPGERPHVTRSATARRGTAPTRARAPPHMARSQTRWRGATGWRAEHHPHLVGETILLAACCTAGRRPPRCPTCALHPCSWGSRGRCSRPPIRSTGSGAPSRAKTVRRLTATVVVGGTWMYRTSRTTDGSGTLRRSGAEDASVEWMSSALVSSTRRSARREDTMPRGSKVALRTSALTRVPSAPGSLGPIAGGYPRIPFPDSTVHGRK